MPVRTRERSSANSNATERVIDRIKVSSRSRRDFLERNVLEAEKRRKTFTLLIISGLAVVFVPLFLLGIRNLVINGTGFSPNRNYPEEYTNSSSTILKRVIQVCNDIIRYQLQIEKFLAGQPLASLLKTRLQPIQDRLGSLRTQTSQYEKMERVSGGPKSFIQSTIDELEKMEETAIGQLDTEERPQAKTLRDSYAEIIMNGYFVVDIHQDPLLLSQHVYLAPLTDYEDAAVLHEMTKFTLEDILTALEMLVPKLEKNEMAYQRMVPIEALVLKGELEYDPNDENGDYHKLQTEYLKWSAVVEREVDNNYKRYQLLIPLKTQRTEKVESLQNAIIEYHANKRKAFLDLKSTIENDIKKLKVRVQNLRYKYAKIS